MYVVPIKISFSMSEYSVNEDVGLLEVCVDSDAGLPVPTMIEITSYQLEGEKRVATGEIHYIMTSQN